MNSSLYFCALFSFLFHISICQNIISNYNAPEKNIDYLGNDVANKIVNDANACAAECDKFDWKNCVGFIYYNKSFYGLWFYNNQQAYLAQGSCYLKSSMETTYTWPDNASIYAYKRSLRSSANKVNFYWKLIMLTSILTISSSYSFFS